MLIERPKPAGVIAALAMLSIAALFCIISVEAWADSYKYTDEKGVLHLTDSYDSIPDKHKSNAVKMKEDHRTDGFMKNMVSNTATSAGTAPGVSNTAGIANSTSSDKLALMGKLLKEGGKDGIDPSIRNYILIGMAVLALILFVLIFWLVQSRGLQCVLMISLMICLGIGIFTLFKAEIMSEGAGLFDSLSGIQKTKEKQGAIVNTLTNEQ